MSQAEHITLIRAFLAQTGEGHWTGAAELATGLDLPELQVRSALAQMFGQELVQAHQFDGRTYYAKSSAFIWRKITPLFAGTPEFIVETYEGRLCCWCPSEFDARIIADALRRS